MTGPPRLSSDLDALLRRVAGHDQAAFAEFYDHTKSRVYGLVMRVLRDTGYSEETTQEIYLEVWRNASEFDSAKGSALAWLLTMAHRRAVDRVRCEQAGNQREVRYGAATSIPRVTSSPTWRSPVMSAPGDRVPQGVDRHAAAVHRTGLLRRADVCRSFAAVSGQSVDHQIPHARRPAQPAQLPGRVMTAPAERSDALGERRS